MAKPKEKQGVGIYGSHSLTHSEAVMVNELDMKDWPSFKLTKTSRVLPRDKKKHEQPGTAKKGSCRHLEPLLHRECPQRGNGSLCLFLFRNKFGLLNKELSK